MTKAAVRIVATCGAALLALAAATSASAMPRMAVARCGLDRMRVTIGPLVSEKTEQHTATVLLTNTGVAACVLDGYPTIALFDAADRRIPFAYTHGGDQMITAAHPARVTIKVGHSAVFAFNKNDSLCRTTRRARTLRVTLPDAGTSRSVRLPRYPILDYCSGSDPGRHITVSPIEARLPDAMCRSQGACRSAHVPMCASAQLKIAARHVGAALGTAGGYLAFRNTSTVPCHLSGWPTVVGITASGGAVPAEQRRSTMFGPDPPVQGVPVVVIRPGERAEAVFTVSDIPPGQPPGATCPVYHYLRVTAPGGTRSVLLSTWFKSLGWWLPACTDVWVSMVVPAASLYKG